MGEGKPSPNRLFINTARLSEEDYSTCTCTRTAVQRGAQILFMEPDTACDLHIGPAPCAREAHTGFMNPVVGLLTT